MKQLLYGLVFSVSVTDGYGASGGGGGGGGGGYPQSHMGPPQSYFAPPPAPSPPRASVIQAAASSSYDDTLGYIFDLGFQQRIKKKVKRSRSGDSPTAVGPKRKSREGRRLPIAILYAKN